MLVAVASMLIAAQADLLGRFAAAEFGAKTLTASCLEQHVSASAPGAPSTAFSISLSKPNKARIDMPGELIIADGMTITSYDKESKTYIKKPQTDADLKGQFAGSELCIFGSFFDAGFFDKVRPGAPTKKARRGTTFDCVEAQVEMDGKQTAAFYVDPADKMLKLGEFTPLEGDDKSTTVIFAKEFSVDGSQGADLYAFTPPSGAHEVTLEDLRKANNFEAPPAFSAKAMETFHLRQTDERGNFPNGGHDYCGPTAAGNALAYLGTHGYPNLFQGDDAAALELVGLIASEKYMGTIPSEGTNPGHVIAGLLKYVGEKGYAIQSMGFEGWRSLERAVRGYKLSDTIDFDWVRKGIAMPNTIVLFNLGWYNPDGKGNYSRATGHWVTAVGYGSIDGRDPDPQMYVVHDPARRMRSNDPKDWLTTDIVKLEPMTAGTLTGSNQGSSLPRSAIGECLISGSGVGHYNQAQVPMLDGVVVMTLKPAK